MNPSNLAIVIPVYKDTYFYETLLAFANQSCQNFNLYIGDDNSPNKIENIFKKFEKQSNFFYHKFANNLGQIDLVAQWTRCIKLANEEEYIWFFGDDDKCDCRCVEEFQKTIQKQNYDLYRFNLDVIDQTGKTLITQPDHPMLESHIEFAQKRFNNKAISSITEFIFHKKHFIENGGFVKFPLAWCSDDATWILLSINKGIYTIPVGRVFWRFSGSNISSTISERKDEVLNAITQYILWFNNTIELVHGQKQFATSQIKWFQNQITPLKSNLTIKDFHFSSKKLHRSLNLSYLNFLLTTYCQLFYPKISYRVRKLKNVYLK